MTGDENGHVEACLLPSHWNRISRGMVLVSFHGSEVIGREIKFREIGCYFYDFRFPFACTKLQHLASMNIMSTPAIDLRHSYLYRTLTMIIGKACITPTSQIDTYLRR